MKLKISKLKINLHENYHSISQNDNVIYVSGSGICKIESRKTALKLSSFSYRILDKKLLRKENLI